MTDACLVALCTCPETVAEDLAGRLVESGLAACVNILPGIKSVYRWQGKTETDTEQLLVIKTTAARMPELTGQLRDWHPYELPEIIAVPIETGLPEYLDWIKQCTTAAS